MVMGEKIASSFSLEASTDELLCGADGGGGPASSMSTSEVASSRLRAAAAAAASSGTVPFRKLFLFADSIDIVLMLFGTLGAMANGASMPLLTVIFGNVVNSFGETEDVHQVVRKVSKVSLEFLYLGAGTAVVSFLQVACWMVTGERQAARIRKQYLRSVLRQDIPYFDNEANTGEVINRLSGDTVLIQDAMGEKVGKCIQLVSTFVGGFAVAFAQGWRLTLVMLSIIPPIIVAGAAMSLIIARAASKGITAYAEASIVVEQTVGSIRTVSSFTGEKRAVEKFKEGLKSAYKASVKEGFAAGVGLGTIMLILNAAYALGIWYGAKLIIDKGYNGGRIISVIMAVFGSSMSLGQASPCINAFAAGKAAAFKMLETINRKPNIDAYDSKGKDTGDIRGDIELRNVFFSYPTRPGEHIFSGFSLSIPSGRNVALVGGSGSGKSTVISLIERFYDPQEGEVLIDDVNIKNYQLRWIRGKIGLVSQEPALFATSIRENIAYGKDGATNEQIRNAATLANASKFIDKLPQGFDTLVGEHGTQLSGGQKQRIAIARAILKDPRILLLDEATSALDVESEQTVQEALDRVMTTQTTVTVAHRLTTIRNAHLIAVIHKGTIVEKGSHMELLKDADGAYSQLIRMQETNQGNADKNEHENEDIDGNVPIMQLSLFKSFKRSTSERTNSISANRQLNHSSSYKRSASQKSSRESGGQIKNDKLSMSFRLPLGLEIKESKTEESDPEETDKSKKPSVPLRRLAYLNKPELPHILFGTLGAIVCGGMQPVSGILLSHIIKIFFEPATKLRKDSKYWSIVFLLCGVVLLLGNIGKSYFFGVAGSELVRRIRILTFEKVVNMEIGWFDDPENASGAIGARLSADAAKIRGLVGDSLAVTVQNIATIVSALVIAFSTSWELSLLILAMVPMMALNGWIQIKFMKGFSADAKVMYEEASQIANDAVGSIRTVASFSAEEKVIELYENKCEGPMKKGITQGLISGIGFGFSFFLFFGVNAAGFYSGARLVQAGKITFSEVFQVFFALAMASIGMSQSSSVAPDSENATSATASIFAILDRESRIDPNEDSGMTLEGLRGNIEFQHVSFTYPTRPDIQVFHDFCLSIQSGQTAALVGESGSGKSTTISLLQRFYDPTSGDIIIDGILLHKFQLRWLRQQMGLVNQEPVLFKDTIRYNIAYGKDGDASEEEIVAAAKFANAHIFISGLHQGYDTPVGERGTQLSGGQKQRIAIARAIVKNPKILLLDEATSALDAESEKVVQQALDQVMVNRTTMVIAHRLSTIKGADLIGVVKNGMVIEKGTHEQLIDTIDGAYASLVALHRS